MSNLTERRNAAFARLAKERDEALAEVARLRGVLGDMRKRLSGHQHSPVHGCEFCRIVRACDAALGKKGGGA